MAQLGSALRSGRRGPGFKSRLPDHLPAQRLARAPAVDISWDGAFTRSVAGPNSPVCTVGAAVQPVPKVLIGTEAHRNASSVTKRYGAVM